MTNRIPVGTPVTVIDRTGTYLKNYGMTHDDLVVLSDTNGIGYGVGPTWNTGGPAHSRHGWIYFTADEVTAKPTPAFKAGDKVEFIESYADFAKTGDRATVRELAYPEDGPDAIVRFVENIEAAYARRLKLVEEPAFTFKDIQVGDTIRRTATYKGATEVREGVVGTKGSYYWATEQGNYILAYDTDGTTDVTLELLNRPEPEPVKEPTLLEKTEKGDKLVIAFANGTQKVYTKGKGGSWTTVVLMGEGKAHTGFTWSTAHLENEVKRSTVLGHTLIPA